MLHLVDFSLQSSKIWNNSSLIIYLFVCLRNQLICSAEFPTFFCLLPYDMIKFNIFIQLLPCRLVVRFRAMINIKHNL